MNENIETRHPNSPEEAASMNTSQLRKNFLIKKVFEEDAIHLTLSFYDRYIAGGAMPLSKAIELSNPGNLKAKYFLERREMGLINVGGNGRVKQMVKCMNWILKKLYTSGKKPGR